MDYLRRSLYRCSYALSDRLKIVPYLLALQLIRLVLGKMSEREVWLRNSFALGYWSFALSDLDVSVWVDGGREDVAREWEKIAPFKTLLLGGEIQLYSTHFINDFLPYGNPWELRRDPQLLKATGKHIDLQNDMALTVFTVRTLASDKMLLREPLLRQKKWREHFKSFGVSVEDELINWSTVVRFLQQRLPFSRFSLSAVAEALESGIDPLAQDVPFLYRLIYANHYVWGSRFGNDDKELLESANDDIHQFLYFQICWEIWGLSPYTLVTQGYDLVSLEGHIYNQTHLAGMLRISSDQRDFLAAGWKKIREFYGLT